jgi:hypothetical protein
MAERLRIRVENSNSPGEACERFLDDMAAWVRRVRTACPAGVEPTGHDSGSQSLSAVARGHGRLNGAGVVTEVLVPALGMAGERGRE